MIRVTEDSLKPEIKTVFESVLGPGCVTETTSRSGKFDLYLRAGERPLIVEVKAGGIGKLTEAIVQASDYARDVGAHGSLVLLYPEEVRREFPSLHPEEASDFIARAVRHGRLTALILSPFWNARFDGTLPNLAREILRRVSEPVLSDPKLLVDALRESTLEISAKLSGKTRKPLVHEVAASLHLFAELSGATREPTQAENLITDLAGHIFVNQLLLYHLLASSSTYPKLPPLQPVNRREDLTRLFSLIWDIDYKPIYRIDVASRLPEPLLPVVNRIILALKVLRPEAIPHDLLGRLFHEFLPFQTRKQLAAFYTRAVAGEILAALAIEGKTASILDPACGSGTLLVSAYRRKRRLTNAEHERLLKQIYGVDIMPFAAHLAALNLTLQDYGSPTDEVLIGVGNSLDLTPGKKIPHQLPMFEKAFQKVGADDLDAGIFSVPRRADLIIMNPPYTDIKRRIRGVLGKFKNAFSPAQNYWAYFLALADSLLSKRGRIAAVLPRLFLFGTDSRAVRRWLTDRGYEFRYVVRSCKEIAFTEDAKFRDYLVVLDKPPRSSGNSQCAVIYIKKSLEMPIEEATALGEQLRETLGKFRSSSKFIPLDSDEFSVTWLHNEKIGQDILEGKDSLLWSAVCWEKVANGAVLNSFYDIVSQANLVPMQQIFNGKPKWAIRGMEPKPANMYKSAFIARPTVRERASRSVLVLGKERKTHLAIQVFGGRGCSIPKKSVVPGLRTISYINEIFVDKIADWVLVDRFASYDSRLKPMLQPKPDFLYLHHQLRLRASHLAVAKRIDFSARGTCAVAFCSNHPMLTSNQLYQIRADLPLARRLALWVNSTFVLVHLLLRRSETRGSFSDILLDQLADIPVPPPNILLEHSSEWAGIAAQFGRRKLPSLVEQFRTPMHFRQQLDEALISLLRLPSKQERQILDQLPSVYSALLDELLTVSASMRGSSRDEDREPLIFH